jgi:hypothetical protein
MLYCTRTTPAEDREPAMIRGSAVSGITDPLTPLCETFSALRTLGRIEKINEKCPGRTQETICYTSESTAVSTRSTKTSPIQSHRNALPTICFYFSFSSFFFFSLQLESKRRRHTNKSPHYQHSASRPTPLSILLRRSSVDVQMSTDRFGVSLPVLEFLHKRHHIYHIEVLKIFFVNPRQSTRHLRGSGRHVLGLDETEFPAYSQPESRSSLEEKQLGSRSDAGWGERCATSWTLYPRLLMTPS